MRYIFYMENCIGTVPIHLKMTLTAKETAEYNNIGINKIEQYAENAQLSVRAFHRHKEGGQAKEI